MLKTIKKRDHELLLERPVIDSQRESDGRTNSRSKDRYFSRRGIGSLKKVFVDYIDFRQGHRAMVDAVEAGIKQKGKLTLLRCP